MCCRRTRFRSVSVWFRRACLGEFTPGRSPSTLADLYQARGRGRLHDRNDAVGFVDVSDASVADSVGRAPNLSQTREKCRAIRARRRCSRSTPSRRRSVLNIPAALREESLHACKYSASFAKHQRLSERSSTWGLMSAVLRCHS